MNIELKGKGCALEVCKLISSLNSNHREQIIISSFQLDELAEIFSLDKTIKIGILAGKDIERSLQVATILNACSVHLSLKVVTREWIDRAHQI
ncbi:hypothetical protein SPBRAN_875 [uncultured Candidatus Thioglobus sp.]|nr:hypothetical protein SPBRAN_875 [uncultured Candidatus Thioglobus sp.]